MKILTARQANSLERAIDMSKEVAATSREKLNIIDDKNQIYNLGVITQASDQAKTALQNLAITLAVYGKDELAEAIDR
jgi:hypothetical protein